MEQGTSGSIYKPSKAHYTFVLKAVRYGLLTPFFGAGVNLCGRAPGVQFVKPPHDFLPNAQELAAYLAREYNFPTSETIDLARVTQYIEMQGSEEILRAQLYELFAHKYQPTAVHRFFARLPSELRRSGYEDKAPLFIVTTNYDDLMEEAFTEVAEQYDTVTYINAGEYQGKFIHWPFGGEPVIIEEPDEWVLPIEARSIILKIHGAIDRVQHRWNSFVISEDHYIAYPSELPKAVISELKDRNFLFLGYALRDWNLRVIFHRIWGEQKRYKKSWAIQRNPSPYEAMFWARRNVEMFDSDLLDYIRELEDTMQSSDAL